MDSNKHDALLDLFRQVFSYIDHFGSLWHSYLGKFCKTCTLCRLHIIPKTRRFIVVESADTPTRGNSVVTDTSGFFDDWRILAKVMLT